LDTASPRIELTEVRDSQTLETVFAIRKEVFVNEQAVDPEEEYDEFETQSRHFLLLVDDTGAATGRFRSTEKGWKIERMAVLKAYRGRSYGALVLQSMLAVIPRDGRPIYLHAQEHALPFYKRYRFVAEGDRFLEANIPHFKMVYTVK